ncbi:accelerated cell death 11-like [Elaeis guineensis]|uniref:accelerated cell death 11-like n=1 Tax=Elaeis guineensis var. tenera TaxID=51953 RepID=UPI003C6D8B4E
MEGGERPLRKLAEAFHDHAARVSSNREPMELSRFTNACSAVLDLFKLLGSSTSLGRTSTRPSHSHNLLRVKRVFEPIRVIFELLLASKQACHPRSWL